MHTVYPPLRHPTTVLLSHMYHICTQQVFNFQKIIFLLIPSPSQRPTTGLFVNVWLHIHHTADMENDGMSAILCNRSLWSHFCSIKIYMRPPWTLLNCIWRFSTLHRHYFDLWRHFFTLTLEHVILSKHFLGVCLIRLKSLTHSNPAENVVRLAGIKTDFPA